MTKIIVLILLGVFVAPLVGGLISGIDRRLTAWFQQRYGPPIWQPFYDVLKLLGKNSLLPNSWMAFCTYVYFFSAMISVVLFFLQQDLLYILFVQAVGSVFLVIGAYSAISPYSQIGANRELIQMFTYEPLILLVFFGIYLATGTFKISEIYLLKTPLFYNLFPLYIVLGFALTIKLRKSPFDFSTSHHAHQEIVKGFLTEYSGSYLGLIEIGHWFEVVLFLGFCSLFWSTWWVGALILIVVTYILEIFLDNTTSRLTWRWMLGHVAYVGLGLSIVNLIWLKYGMKIYEHIQ